MYRCVCIYIYICIHIYIYIYIYIYTRMCTGLQVQPRRHASGLRHPPGQRRGAPELGAEGQLLAAGSQKLIPTLGFLSPGDVCFPCVFSVFASTWGNPEGQLLTVRPKYHTPEIAKVKFHWKMPLKTHWAIPVKIYWTSDNPLEHTADK